MPDKIKPYREIESIEKEIEKNERMLEENSNNIECLFEESNDYYKKYMKITISKIVLNEAIKVLSEENIKDLLILGKKNKITYGDLIYMLKNKEIHNELSIIYEKLK